MFKTRKLLFPILILCLGFFLGCGAGSSGLGDSQGGFGSGVSPVLPVIADPITGTPGGEIAQTAHIPDLTIIVAKCSGAADFQYLPNNSILSWLRTAAQNLNISSPHSNYDHNLFQQLVQVYADQDWNPGAPSYQLQGKNLVYTSSTFAFWYPESNGLLSLSFTYHPGANTCTLPLRLVWGQSEDGAGSIGDFALFNWQTSNCLPDPTCPGFDPAADNHSL